MRTYKRYLVVIVLIFLAIFFTKDLDISSIRTHQTRTYPDSTESNEQSVRKYSFTTKVALTSSISVLASNISTPFHKSKFSQDANVVKFMTSAYSSINCMKLVQGDENELARARTLMKIPPSHFIPDSYYVNLTQDCSSYKESTGFINHTFGEKYSSFPIAYSIVMYKEVQQTEKLLRAIYRPNNVYCIHVDLDAVADVHEAVAAITRCFDNVFVVSKKESVVYAGLTRLQADLNCMNDLLKHKIKWKYFINLPSQQFPLKTNEEIVEILRIYNGANDIEGITGSRMWHARFQYHFEYKKVANKTKAKLIKTDQKKGPPPHGVGVVKGSAYGVFSRAFVDFVINNSTARDILDWCKDVMSPDEYYWATLNHNPNINPPGGYIGSPMDKPWLAVYAKWGGRCDGKYVRGVCVFGIKDLQHLITRKELFANKFYLTYHPVALECMEKWIHNRTYSKSDLNLTFYRNLPFVKRNVSQ